MNTRTFHIKTVVMDSKRTVFSVRVGGTDNRVEFRGPAYQSWTGNNNNWAERIHNSLEGWHACILHTDDELSILPNHPDHVRVSKLNDDALKKFTEKRERRRVRKNHCGGYIVRTEVSVDQVLPLIGNQPYNRRISIDGVAVGVNSNRLKTYIKGCKCITCGLEGTVFRLERHKQKHAKWHLNLYAILSPGHYMLMTSDHIVPKAKGGPNCVHNRQPMCQRCNNKKGDKTTSRITCRMISYRILAFFGALSFLS